MSKLFVALVMFMVALACVMSCKFVDAVDSRVDTLPYYNDASFTPYWLDRNAPALDTLHRVRDFVLVNQLGDTVTQESLNDQVNVVNFFFTICPGICPKMTENMLDVHDAFIENESVKLMSHSVTPKRDSVAVLADYGAERGINPDRWFLLTGDQKEIYNLGRRSYFIEEDLGLERDDEEFLHTENIVLVDKNRYIRGIYNGLSSVSIQHLVADVNLLLQEDR